MQVAQTNSTRGFFMTKVAETLNRLRQSLDDEEEEELSILHIMHEHHKYLKEYINMISELKSTNQEKQNIITIFLHIFIMHAKAESDTFYPALVMSSQSALRHEGLRGFDEHEITFEIINELKELQYEKNWTEEIDTKVKILAGFIKSHILEEEKVMYPMAKDSMSKIELVRLGDKYLDKCKTYLDIEMEALPSVVSRNDVMTFFY